MKVKIKISCIQSVSNSNVKTSKVNKSKKKSV